MNNKKLIILMLLCLVVAILACSSMYYLDAPVSYPIMFASDIQNSDLARVEDGGLVGSAGECPT